MVIGFIYIPVSKASDSVSRSKFCEAAEKKSIKGEMTEKYI